MKKVILLISIFLLATLVLIGAGCGEENGEENGEEEEKVGGSCNRIVEDDSNSVCTDYIGTNAHKSVAPCPKEYYSTESCPPSSIGGCKFHAGSDKEYIIWSYYSSLWTEDAIIESRDSCNALRTYRGMDTQAVSPTK